MALDKNDKEWIEGIMTKYRDFASFSALIMEVKEDQKKYNEQHDTVHQEIRKEIKEIKEIIQNTPLANKIVFSTIGIIVIGAVTALFSLVWDKIHSILR